jgi:hypothetical protein
MTRARVRKDEVLLADVVDALAVLVITVVVEEASAI